MARKKAKHDPTKQADVNITSLIDITFLLIVFFISIWQVAQMELAAALTLPMVSQGNPELQQDKDRLIVNIDADKQVYIARTRMTQEELGAVLARESQRSHDAEGFGTRPVYIRADANLPFGVVQDIMRVARDAQVWKLSLRVTEPPPGGEAE